MSDQLLTGMGRLTCQGSLTGTLPTANWGLDSHAKLLYFLRRLLILLRGEEGSESKLEGISYAGAFVFLLVVECGVECGFGLGPKRSGHNYRNCFRSSRRGGGECSDPGQEHRNGRGVSGANFDHRQLHDRSTAGRHL